MNNIIRFVVLAAVTFCSVPPSAVSADDPAAGPFPPDEAVERFQLHPAVQIELVASEPQIVDPVDIEFGPDGRLWVVEMRDYPNGPAEGEPPLSRIKVLTDADGDGFYEQATVFAEELTFANGLMLWRDGVIATVGGDVMYLADTDGDGRADVQEKWFTGFKEENPQLRANHPTLGPDGWIYIASGLRGGEVVAVKPEWQDGADPVNLSGRDFRFHPQTGAYEAISGVGQFGLCFDEWGRRFVCSNRNPCKHIVLEEHVIARNPFLAVSAVFEDVSPAAENSRLYPISRTWTTSNLHANQFTAACGVRIYPFGSLPAEFHGNSFTCEPTANLVHRDVLRPDGATFTSSPGRDGVEFLATKDEWFRPVNLKPGPGGHLYVIDMYRAVIEHPQFMPEELKTRPDLRWGDDRGRIYRLRAAGTDKPKPPTSLAGIAPAKLAAALDNQDVWQRRTAFRLLLERNQPLIAEKIGAIAYQAENPETRGIALQLLDAADVIDWPAVRQSLQDPSDRVLEQAVIIGNRRFADRPEFHAELRKLAESRTDQRLRFQLALALGASEDESTPEVLATIAVAQSRDRWMRAAIGTARPEMTSDILQAIIGDIRRQPNDEQVAAKPLLIELAQIVGSRQDAGEIAATLRSLFGIHGPVRPPLVENVRLAGLNGLAEGLRRRGKRLSSIAESLPPELRVELAGTLQRASGIAADKTRSEADRIAAVKLLAAAPSETAVTPLLELFNAGGSRPIKLAVVDALADHREERIAEAFLQRLRSETPAVRGQLLAALTRSPSWITKLLDAIDAGTIPAAQIDPATATRLKRHPQQELRARAVKLLEQDAADRQQVIDEYRPALAAETDPLRGKKVFTERCATCHRIGEVGVNVAPDIADSRTRTPEQLLTNILDPNRAIDNNYFSYSVVDVQGRVHTGIISAETASSITLKQPEGKEVTLLRQDVEEMFSNGVSLMPVGLEKQITPEQMADLVSFIKNWRYLDGQVPESVLGK